MSRRIHDDPREYRRLYAANRRRELISLGLCVDCKGASPDRTRCTDCRRVNQLSRK